MAIEPIQSYVDKVAHKSGIDKKTTLAGMIAAAEHARTIKEPLAKLFGCNEDGRAELTPYQEEGQCSSSSNDEATLLVIYRILSSKYSIDDIVSEQERSLDGIRNVVKANRMNNGQKTGRTFLKVIKETPSIFEQIAKDENIASSRISKGPEVFYQEYTSSIADCTASANIIISVNYWDMIGASENCNWSSCFNLEGDYRVAAHHHAASPDAAIVFAESPKTGKKVFRAWLFTDGQSWNMDRIYGFISEDNKRNLIKTINARLSGITNKMWLPGAVSVDMPKRHNGLYFDNSHNGQGFVEGSKRHLSIAAGVGICLVCGKQKINTYERHSYTCESCLSSYFKACKSCQRKTGGEFIVNGEYYCRDCFDEKFFICKECGQPHAKSGVMETLIQEQLCPSCFTKFYSICEACGKIDKTGPGKRVCGDCAKNKDLVECGKCGQYTTHHRGGLCIKNGCYAGVMIDQFFA